MTHIRLFTSIPCPHHITKTESHMHERKVERACAAGACTQLRKTGVNRGRIKKRRKCYCLRLLRYLEAAIHMRLRLTLKVCCLCMMNLHFGARVCDSRLGCLYHNVALYFGTQIYLDEHVTSKKLRQEFHTLQKRVPSTENYRVMLARQCCQLVCACQ